MPTLNTAAPCWRMKLLKRLSLLSVRVLTGCSTNYAVAPRLPTPAADLMTPESTGSEYLEVVLVFLWQSPGELKVRIERVS